MQKLQIQIQLEIQRYNVSLMASGCVYEFSINQGATFICCDAEFVMTGSDRMKDCGVQRRIVLCGERVGEGVDNFIYGNLHIVRKVVK